MLELHNVTKTFGKHVTAVADVSLRLEPGVVGLIGHNYFTSGRSYRLSAQYNF